MAAMESVPDFPKLEREVFAYWQENKILEKYLKRNNDSQKRFRFIDGPITANNPMGVHHAWGRTYKDFFQRYKNMQGFKQRFQNGFDCQGLWLEVEEEKSRGFNSKKDIENFGLDRFSEACRSRVEKYSAIQTEQSKRLGMFMDWENSYYTMSETNNLYIWYFLKKCHEKGWLYKGVNSMPWCVRCGTAISQHELSDEGYRMVKHASVYVNFPLKEEPQVSLLIWTTTPWTLLANVAVAVNPDFTYVKVKSDGIDGSLILAKDRLNVLKGPYTVTEEIKGDKLLGLSYSGPYDELPAQKGVAHPVIGWEDVSEAEGTGLVHIAPGAGEEDFMLGKKYGLTVLAPLDEYGIYVTGYGAFTGKDARKINNEVFESLAEKNRFYKQEDIIHSYPHCWRCKEPLVFRVTEEWFIRVDPQREKLKEIAEKVDWRPSYIGKRMQDWLNNMEDWPISRRRYWGLALPFYECACGRLTVVGSKEELRNLAVVPEMVDRLKELHRPWIDEIKIKCPNCGEEVDRVAYVGDCWLDAGIVPFSTLKYLEDRDYWEEWFPAEMIAEYVAQVKLWFYSLLFMSVTLEGRAPYNVVFTDGYVVDEKGEVMHKSKGNAIWFDEAAEKMGVDIMRWVYLRADPSRDLRFGYGVGEEIRRRMSLILWNSVKFVLDNDALDKVSPGLVLGPAPDSDLPVVDRWIISRLMSTIKTATAANDNYEPQRGSLAIEALISDASTWFIRRSRSRIGPTSDDQKAKEPFYKTAYYLYFSLVKLLAPYTPFWVERLYKLLGGSKESIHLESWPEVKEEMIDTRLEEKMAQVRKICELGHAQRKELKIRVRQPLTSIKIKVQSLRLKVDAELEQLIRDELNVKQILWEECKDAASEMAVALDTAITPELKAEGEAREIIRSVQELRKGLGCRLDDRIFIKSPAWPEAYTDMITKETLATEIIRSSEPLSISIK